MGVSDEKIKVQWLVVMPSVNRNLAHYLRITVESDNPKPDQQKVA